MHLRLNLFQSTLPADISSLTRLSPFYTEAATWLATIWSPHDHTLMLAYIVAAFLNRMTPNTGFDYTFAPSDDGPSRLRSVRERPWIPYIASNTGRRAASPSRQVFAAWFAFIASVLVDSSPLRTSPAFNPAPYASGKPKPWKLGRVLLDQLGRFLSMASVSPYPLTHSNPSPLFLRLRVILYQHLVA
jgi:hypothetical protein